MLADSARCFPGLRPPDWTHKMSAVDFCAQISDQKVLTTGGFWSVPAGFWWVQPGVQLGSCFSKHVSEKLENLFFCVVYKFVMI